MDATEFNQYNSRPLRPEIFELPAIKDLNIRLVDFTPPKFNHIKSHLEKYREAVEITIVTDGLIPARAATPVLFIGSKKISYYTKGKKENEYHFYAFDWKKLKEGDVIHWGWDNDPPEAIQKTKFYFKIAQTKK